MKNAISFAISINDATILSSLKVNILVLNWTWYPSGGDWTYIENITRVYEQHGHKVIPFSMKDDRNLPSQYEDYFIENIDYKKLNRSSVKDGAKAVWKSIYSVEANTNLEQLLNDVHIDMVHVNVILRYITPSVLKIIKKKNIPIIWILHDYTAICPESTFISHDKICERCIGGAFYNCVTNTCKKGSVAASLVAASESYINHALNYYKYVDHYICPSVFTYNKFKQFNFFKEKLVQIYYAFDYTLTEVLVNKPIATDDDYIVFVGRLEKIKGIYTLLEAMKSNRHIKLLVVGDGTQDTGVRAFIRDNQLQNVVLMGKQTKEQTLQIVHGASFLICPSEWYEVLGFTIVEAMGLKKPVIGAAIGAIPELVIEDYTGYLFEAGNAAELAIKIGQLYGNTQLINQLGVNAYNHARGLVNNEQHYNGLKTLISNL